MQFGVSDRDIEYIKEIIKAFHEVDAAMIFGSRAMGNYKKGSDIDIALVGEKVNFDILAKIKDLLQEESPMPYFFDIVDLTHCNSPDLKKHIEHYGTILYEK